MQFLITQTHEPEDCPKDIGGFRKVFINENVKGRVCPLKPFVEYGLSKSNLY